MIKNNIDIVCISETKLDNSFPIPQFEVEGYSTPFRKDINFSSGGMLVYVNKDIPSKLLKNLIIPSDCQIMPIEINLRKSKWLVVPIYKPPSTNDEYFLENLNRVIEFYADSFENIIVLGDFNLEPSVPKMDSFIKVNEFTCLYKKPTCFKSKKGSCIDLLLTNKSRSFKHTHAFETGLSDFHLLVYTMFRTTFEKIPPINISYRTYKHFHSKNVSSDIVKNHSHMQNYQNLESCLLSILDKHAPMKSKKLRSNSKPYMTKSIRNAIAIRSRLKNVQLLLVQSLILKCIRNNEIMLFL